MTMQQLVDASPVLRKIAGQELSMKTLYGVSKIFAKLDDELKFYDRRRAELLEEYCDKREDRYIPMEGCVDEFNRKFGELLNLEIDIGEFSPAKIPASEPMKLSYQELQAVKDFVEIEWEE